MGFVHDGAASPPVLVLSSLCDGLLDMFSWMRNVHNTSSQKFWPGAESCNTWISRGYHVGRLSDVNERSDSNDIFNKHLIPSDPVLDSLEYSPRFTAPHWSNHKSVLSFALLRRREHRYIARRSACW